MARTSRTPKPSGQPKATNKWDFEIAKMQGKTDVLRTLVYGIIVALCIAAAALPLWMMHGIIQPLAGKKTEVSLNLPITIALGISVVANLAQHVKGRSRRGELKRQRERAEKYEVDLGVTL
jgi:hypothetical protein